MLKKKYLYRNIKYQKPELSEQENHNLNDWNFNILQIVNFQEK